MTSNTFLLFGDSSNNTILGQSSPNATLVRNNVQLPFGFGFSSTVLGATSIDLSVSPNPPNIVDIVYGLFTLSGTQTVYGAAIVRQ